MVEHKLTADEKSRNTHGPMHLFMYTKKNLGMCMILYIYICILMKSNLIYSYVISI